ncbi:MAG: GNAT family N-acetyltransferase [Bacteroidetes bacterium MED-G21]|nr:MAG: GNAT family N-acetyltransferase [Bacteroidetes bacterium MED-G21]|tara:strand:- start:1817 stop:2269 length:453 start_codon:yes stop_codon:yes gene_type:complete
MNKLNIYIKSYNELNKRELFDIYFLRQEVFIVEQNCIYQDIDQKDHCSYHLMAYDNEILVAYLRIVYPGISYDEPSIGRVLTKIDYRGRGIANNIMKYAIQKVRDVYNHSNIRISAQEYLIPFYTSLNFESIGEVYLEDDIPHIEMMHKD